MRKPLGTIEEEAAACLAAWAGHGVGAWAKNFHHQTLIETLPELPEVRIAFFLSNKPKVERARRLREFRPWVGEIPEKLARAGAEYVRTWAEYVRTRAEHDRARAEYVRTRAEHDRARAEYDHAWAEYDQARAECARARAECRDELEAQHKITFPDSMWDGETIFGEGREK